MMSSSAVGVGFGGAWDEEEEEEADGDEGGGLVFVVVVVVGLVVSVREESLVETVLGITMEAWDCKSLKCWI